MKTVLKKNKGTFDFGSFEQIYSQGDAKNREDGFSISADMALVVDAFSGPFCAEHPAIIHNGMTLGELSARTAEKTFQSQPTLPNVLRSVNSAIHEQKTDIEGDPEIIRLAGLCFAAMKVSASLTHIITGGDCFALVEQKNGEIFFTENQVAVSDQKMHQTIEKIMSEIAAERNVELGSIQDEELSAIRREMWNRFYPILKKEKIRVINNAKTEGGYSFLNGDPNFDQLWQSKVFQSASIKRIILFSDGLVDWSILKFMPNVQLSVFLLELYKRSELEGILDFTRSIETAKAGQSYTNFCEAVAIALNFE